MTGAELEKIFRINSGVSLQDGLRGVFNAGYALGAGLSASSVGNGDPSSVVTYNNAAAVTPTVKNRKD